MRTIIAWHWVSSAISLIGMLLFAITGVTLNHASQIESDPVTRSVTADLPPDLKRSLSQQWRDGTGPLPREVARWLSDQTAKQMGSRQADWSEDEVYLSMPGPGSDAWLAIDRESGGVEFEQIHRGWISYFNDLHKGRHTGPVWTWVLDLFSVATVVFCITGLLLLILHARRRPLTWPLVALGFVAPLLVTLLLIH